MLPDHLEELQRPGLTVRRYESQGGPEMIIASRAIPLSDQFHPDPRQVELKPGFR